MWKCKITFCTEVGEKLENSAHTTSVTNSNKQTHKYCPRKIALARYQTSNMIVFITKSHKISKHPSCKSQTMKANVFQHLLVKI